MIVWREKMSIGHALIDADHRYLLCLINSVELALRTHEPLDELLAQLVEYAHFHFEREERIQQDVHFAHLEHHRREHAKLATQLASIVLQLGAALPEDAPGHATAGTVEATEQELVDLLRHWLIDHILREDLQLKPWLAGHPTAVQA